MTHPDHVELIKGALEQKGGIWADLGSGWGAFTLALRDLAGPDIRIYSVDQSKNSLTEQQVHFSQMFPKSNIDFIEADFTKPLSLPALDGILMANSLHYVENQKKFLTTVKSYLKPTGKVVVVEYDTDKGNKWVPYPLKFEQFAVICKKAGYKEVVQVGKTDSTWLDGMYCAVSSC